MQVIVRARHIKLTPALTAHAEAKLGQALMRVFDRPAAKVDIELSALAHTQNGNDKSCRVTVFIPKGKPVVISETDDDMYKAINVAHDRVLNRVKRARGRVKGPSRPRKAAEAARAHTARRALRAEPELWEQEVAEFEGSTHRLA